MPEAAPEFPALATESLILRAFAPEDATAFQALLAMPEVTRHTNWPDAPNAEKAARFVAYMSGLFAKRVGCGWAIEDRASGRLIGAIRYNYFVMDWKRGEVGYELHPAHWGRGLMTEALRSVVLCGHQHFGLNRIDAWTLEGNGGSDRVLEKAGFRYEGTQRQKAFFKSRFTISGPSPGSRKTRSDRSAAFLDRLAQRRHAVSLAEAALMPDAPEPALFDAVILAGTFGQAFSELAAEEVAVDPEHHPLAVTQSLPPLAIIAPCRKDPQAAALLAPLLPFALVDLAGGIEKGADPVHPAARDGADVALAALHAFQRVAPGQQALTLGRALGAGAGPADAFLLLRVGVPHPATVHGIQRPAGPAGLGDGFRR
ncbi:MAG: ribosomal-protein-alanine N-acetyltransferase, partial [Rubritepida sp.]|nr:ribosomal-protein-alanine N-acetyltransferase [Rubritepida sp.]